MARSFNNNPPIYVVPRIILYRPPLGGSRANSLNRPPLGGSQVLSNWDDTGTDMWSTRFNSAGGCSYAGENSGTFSDPNGVTSGADYSGWLHVIMVS